MNDLTFLKSIRGKKVLVAPLDWGLGHATRTACIIESLKDENEIHIASSGLALKWLQRMYPALTSHLLPSYNICYRFEIMWLNILTSFPHIISSIFRENHIICQLTEENRYDLIIADHRYGSSCNLCKSVVIAHQIQIPHTNPMISLLASHLNRKLLNRYDEVWIPDFEDGGKSLAGKLSNTLRIKKPKHIGPLSLMRDVHPRAEKEIDLAIILSGPEPSRTNIEVKLTKTLEGYNKKSIILIRGTNLPVSSDIQQSKIFKTIIDLADSKTVCNIILRSNSIICRSGYSTLMDLDTLGRKAILIPTNNQPEQEYLASYHSMRGYKTVTEDNIEQDLIRLL